MIAPEISVIVTTFQRPHLLPRAVSSVMRQEGVSFEVVVVDDNAPADHAATRKALAPWIDDERLRLIVPPAPTGACARSRNVGLDAARGQWIAFLDDDDAYEPDKLRAQWACARETGSPVVLGGLTYRLRWRQRARQIETDRFAGDDFLLRVVPSVIGLLYRADPALRFNVRFDAAEDLEFLISVTDFYRLDAVPNVPRALASVYPQAKGGRVNTRWSELWPALRWIWWHRTARFSPRARRIFVLRQRLQRTLETKVAWRHYGRNARRLLAAGGRAELRLVINIGLRRTRWWRDSMVS